MNYHIPEPPKDIFIPQNHLTDAVIRENAGSVLIIDHIDYAHGIQVYYKDCPHPRKGFPTPGSTVAINLCKRTFMELLKLKPLRWKKALKAYTAITYKEIEPYLLKYEYMTPFARQVQTMANRFLQLIGVEVETSERFSKVFAAIMEYDAPYRYRLQDVLSTTTSGYVADFPREEVKRMFLLLKSRETYAVVVPKMKLVVSLLTFALLIPKVRKAFITVIEESNFHHLQLDADDRYWVLRRTDYNFFGETYEERSKGMDYLQGYSI